MLAAEIICEDEDFSTLCAALTQTGLDIPLGDGDSTWTLFAPTDAAFGLVPEQLASDIFESDSNLSNVLLYHAVAGKEIFSHELYCTWTITMANQRDTRTVCVNGQFFQKGAGNSREMMPQIVRANTEACNGVIHVVDEVILPRRLPDDPYGNSIPTPHPTYKPWGPPPTKPPKHKPYGKPPKHKPYGKPPAHKPYGKPPTHKPYGKPYGNPKETPFPTPYPTPFPTHHPTTTPTTSGSPPPTGSPAPTSSPAPSGSPTTSPAPTNSPAPTTSAAPSGAPTISPAPTNSPAPTVSAAPSGSPTISPAPTTSPGPTASPAPTGSASPTLKDTPYPTPFPTPYPTNFPTVQTPYPMPTSYTPEYPHSDPYMDPYDPGYYHTNDDNMHPGYYHPNDDHMPEDPQQRGFPCVSIGKFKTQQNLSFISNCSLLNTTLLFELYR